MIANLSQKLLSLEKNGDAFRHFTYSASGQHLSLTQEKILKRQWVWMVCQEICWIR